MTHEIDNDVAETALLLEMEIDKRVMVAFARALRPDEDWLALEVGKAYDSRDMQRVSRVVQGMFATAVLEDGSLMHTVRRHINERMGIHL